ncbi:class I SAM-dependent methyltransferase [Geobacter sp. DSM 9736]|uniref:class I SAM-dependent methyltransferase n=1 Tax=Geobacter sp. DSM 9736 TaxID=1277350 RepID=UPI000B510C04|nr:class I SAM-dependent methyltransferase [Geobacter sp. DSM 9736]SNB45130.1 SAM-dependent methyltransferase [Geobacter sp. DSM 9736]
MKVRDSGMPEEEMWSTFFDPSSILSTLGFSADTGDIVEFGCGYGTFTLPAAALVSGTVSAFDIEPEMVATVRKKCRAQGIRNVAAEVRDFVADGTGRDDDSQDGVLLFNILHHEEPVQLMREACRIVRPGGVVAVIHWNYDPSTPRGPAMEIRPKPEQCISWGVAVGFDRENIISFHLPPYHYGLLFRKSSR